MSTLSAKAEDRLPSVNSSEIYSILKSNQDVFVAQKEAMDAITADINTIEKYFQSQAVYSTFSMRCSDSYRDTEDEPHFLEWCEDKHGKFRLHCGIDGIVMDSDSEKPRQHRERKPLVETQAAIRAALYPCLPRFIEKFAKFLREKSPDSVVIPF